MRVKRIMIFCVCILIVGSWFFLSFRSYSKISNEETKEHTAQSESSTKEQGSENDILTTIHYMANTLIVPKDGQIWGKEKITKDKIELLIQEVNSSNFSYKTDLLIILNKWKKNDFSTVVDDHNLVWKLLDGTVGRADKIDENAVKEVMTELNSN